MTPAQLTKYFAFLDKLRESGATNMYGTRPYIQRRFACGSEEAKTVHRLWMDTFDAEAKLSERVKKALSESKVQEGK